MVLRDTTSFIYSVYNDITMTSDWEVLSLIKIKSSNNISSNGKINMRKKNIVNELLLF